METVITDAATDALADKILAAIKSDDKTTFDNLNNDTPCGEYRLGRFPVLSVIYLYGAKKIKKAYEEKFLKYNGWKQIKEPVALSSDFMRAAGKSLRFYVSEIVTPAEMLLILGDTAALKKTVARLKPSAAVKGRIKSVYAVKYGLEADFKGDTLVLPKKQWTRGSTIKLASIIAAAVFVVAFAVGTPFIVNDFNAFIPSADGTYSVKRASAIDFASDKTYVLANDVEIDQSFFAEEFNCTLDGNGKTITVKGDCPFGTLSGTIKNATVVAYSTVFDKIAVTGSVEKCAVDAVLSGETTAGFGVLANENYGAIQGLTVNVSGSLSVREGEETDDGLLFGGIVKTNGRTTVAGSIYTYIGVVDGCTVRYDNFTLAGEVKANASFGGAAAVNDGQISNVVIEGNIASDTVDIAGVCITNNYYLAGNLNKANLTQSSASAEWNPLVAGICVTNKSRIELCVNSGRLKAWSTCGETVGDRAPQTLAAGIAAHAYGYVFRSANYGEVVAEGSGEAYAGGIACISYAELSYCRVAGDVAATGNRAYAGGILAYSTPVTDGVSVFAGRAAHCIVGGEVKAVSSSGNAFCGGIIGFINEHDFAEYFEGDDPVWRGGGVANCYFTGALVCENGRTGAIAGACGNHLLADKSYESGETQKNYFENNYFVATNSEIIAIGAGIWLDDDKNEVFEEGANLGAASASIPEIEALQDYKSTLALIPEIAPASDLGL